VHVWGDESRAIKHGAQGNKSTLLGTVPIDGVNRVVDIFQGQFCKECGAWRGSLGLEPTPELFISHLVQVFREVRRVLKDSGTLWCNIGDSYAGYWGDKYAHKPFGKDRTPDETTPPHKNSPDFKASAFKPKDLVGIPWMLAFALRADGWYLRSDIIWHKPNPMPESVKDRPTKSHEYIFLLSKNRKYFYDADAIKEPVATSTIGRGPVDFGGAKGRDYKANIKKTDPNYRNGSEQWGRTFDYRESCKNGRNKRSVWTVTTKPYKEAHFATFPPDLIEPCIKAGCPDNGTVLDPFGGACTTAIVAEKLNRRWVIAELSNKYCEISKNRIADATRQQKLFPVSGGRIKNEIRIR